MMLKQEAEEIFEVAAKDSQVWLAKAKRLKLSADIIKPELHNLIQVMWHETGMDAKFIALMESYMLLNGMAFENLIKGILIGRDPLLVSREVINREILPRQGHGISEGAKKVRTILDEEHNLLKRIEEFLFWASRYPMPIRSSVFLNSQNPENLRSFRTSDFDLIENLFNQFAEILVDEWKQRELLPSA